MNVLIACEESQRVCISFRERGHNAFSCDIQECSGGHPEWHIQGDVLEILNPREEYNIMWQHDYTESIQFQTMDGTWHKIPKWDLIIAHPPCTFLTNTGNRWFDVKRYGEKARERYIERLKAADFFMIFVNADCKRVAIENHIGYMSTAYRKPDQIIQPFQFGHPTRKATCLWLKGLPPLIPTDVVQVDNYDYYEYTAKNGKKKHDAKSRCSGSKSEWAKNRSKTYWGIARAMAEQWG